MYKPIEYYYKGYDVTNTSRLERLKMEYSNPYGYNLESNNRRVIDYEKKAIYTNQDNKKH